MEKVEFFKGREFTDQDAPNELHWEFPEVIFIDNDATYTVCYDEIRNGDCVINKVRWVEVTPKYIMRALNTIEAYLELSESANSKPKNV